MDNSFHIAWCPFCNQGWVDIVQDAISNELFVLCDECDTKWNNPIDVQQNKPVLYDAEDKVKIPVLDEIQKSGWDKWLISISDVIVKPN
jgi:predicted AAA+ superfamily ATPase